MPRLEMILGGMAVGVTLGLLGWWALAAVKRRRAFAVVRQRFLDAANERVLGGVRSILGEARLEPGPVIGEWTGADTRRVKATVGQLYHPSDELFPLLRHKLPLRCQYKVHSCPALVHPLTGTLFGIRVGTYLCLLRLTGAARREAVEGGAAWPQDPLPNLKKYDLAALFGPEWVVPNSGHAAIARYYQAAFEQAGPGAAPPA